MLEKESNKNYCKIMHIIDCTVLDSIVTLSNKKTVK